jgi:RNA polymerase sigma factor (sigma-70 family)
MPGVREFRSKDSDRALVRRFARHHDGEAFSILMNRYADMVYTTCWRMLGNEALAADAMQETFFHLVKNADRITGSLGSWLHKVATRRSVDFIRQNVARRNREESYALDGDSRENSWSEVHPVVDEALEELPEDLREVLLLHFMQGCSTIQIAAEKGVSQPTISRRLAEGLTLLRTSLRKRGIHAGVVPLQAVLLHSNYVAPEVVRASLGKIALAKAAGVVPAKVAIAAVMLALATGTFILSMPTKNNPKPVVLPQAQVSDTAAKPVDDGETPPEAASVQTAVVAEIAKAPSPIPTPMSTPPTSARTPQRAPSVIPPLVKSAPTNSISPPSSPVPIASSTPLVNNWSGNAGRFVPTVPTELPFRNANATREFDWVPSLYKPSAQQFNNERIGTNSDPRNVQSPPVISPNANRAFAPSRNSARSAPVIPPRNGKSNKAN